MLNETMTIEFWKKFVIYRVSSNEENTLGVLLYDAQPFAVTLELPLIFADNGNTSPNVSCIPTGHYHCVRTDSPRFGDTFEVTKVPGRSHILFHKGNTPKNTKGCILVAESFTTIGGASGIGQSSVGFSEFMEILGEDKAFNLLIKEI